MLENSSYSICYNAVMEDAKTLVLDIQTLCVHCENRCRYCLLSYDGKDIGAEYERSERYAEGFYHWLQDNRPEIRFMFSFGSSMDHPDLKRAVSFMQKTNSPGGEILQMNGLRFRNDEEMFILLSMLKEQGIQSLNFTFYGLENYHDHFAGRKGDYAYLLRMAKKAADLSFNVTAGIPLYQDNVDQIEELVSVLSDSGVTVRCFIPHSEGRGKLLESIRLREADLEGKNILINREIYRSEREWLKCDSFKNENGRMLILSLLDTNIDYFEGLGFEKALHELEELDETYYGSFPDVNELVRLYGNPDSEYLYSQRDLLDQYRKQYLKDHQIDVYDVTDERYSGSRRFSV